MITLFRSARITVSVKLRPGSWVLWYSLDEAGLWAVQVGPFVLEIISGKSENRTCNPDRPTV